MAYGNSFKWSIWIARTKIKWLSYISINIKKNALIRSNWLFNNGISKMTRFNRSSSARVLYARYQRRMSQGMADQRRGWLAWSVELSPSALPQDHSTSHRWKSWWLLLSEHMFPHGNVQVRPLPGWRADARGQDTRAGATAGEPGRKHSSLSGSVDPVRSPLSRFRPSRYPTSSDILSFSSVIRHRHCIDLIWQENSQSSWLILLGIFTWSYHTERCRTTRWGSWTSPCCRTRVSFSSGLLAGPWSWAENACSCGVMNESMRSSGSRPTNCRESSAPVEQATGSIMARNTAS